MCRGRWQRGVHARQFEFLEVLLGLLRGQVVMVLLLRRRRTVRTVKFVQMTRSTRLHQFTGGMMGPVKSQHDLYAVDPAGVSATEVGENWIVEGSAVHPRIKHVNRNGRSEVDLIRLKHFFGLAAALIT